MAEDTKIAWCDDTVNPWWGCQRVSPGCEKCYAEAFSHRLGRDIWGPGADRWIRVEAAIKELHKIARRSDREGRPRRVFIASMSDVFERRDDLVAPRAVLFDALDAIGPRITVLLLTKRPENVRYMVPVAWLGAWPSHVWMGTTAEDQRRADERIPHLIDIPAAVRFVSYEPALGPVHFADVPGFNRTSLSLYGWWVIVGGESGRGARRFVVEWGRSVVAQCRAVNVPVFVKQLGASPSGLPGMIRDPKGGDPSEWPEDLRVREFPKGVG